MVTNISFKMIISLFHPQTGIFKRLKEKEDGFPWRPQFNTDYSHYQLIFPLYIEIDKDSFYELMIGANLQYKMGQYFNTIPSHLQGYADIDVKPNSKLCSIGSDDLICWMDLATGEKGQKQLPSGHGLNHIALYPQGDKIVLGGSNKQIIEMSLTDNLQQVIYETLGPIYDLKVSKTGRYISAATHQPKCILIDTLNKRKSKCRPGHSQRILNTFFSSNEKYVVSIGEDGYLLVYELKNDQDPHEVFRVKIAHQTLPDQISGCFDDNKIYVPGLQQLQVIDGSDRWEIKKSKMVHASPILICQSLRKDILLTSCAHDICIWNAQLPQRIVVLEEFPLHKVVLAGETFFGVRGDGRIYEYNRPIPSAQPDRMDIEEESKIEFDEAKDQIESEEEHEVEVQYVTSKKTKADKIITTYPQLPLSRATTPFSNHRFLYVNFYGCVYENTQNQQTKIQKDFHDQNKTKTLFYGKDFKLFSMNGSYFVYANQTTFGLKSDNGSWDKSWNDIVGVALGATWTAIANQYQIKIFDFAGNQIKSISFDRQILTVEGYQNLLVVVYHEGIPMWGAQNISMCLFNINSPCNLKISQCHVPIRPQSTLRWFGFSQEGMLFSQDSSGILRVYSLQTNEWSSLAIDNQIENKKIFIVGIKDYKLCYWKTTDAEPTVRPRFNMKQGDLSIATLQLEGQQLSQYPYLLWNQYCLEHELARWRLWGKHKQSRKEENHNYQLSSSILTERQIKQKMEDIQKKFFPIIETYLKAGHGQRALMVVKSHIRSIKLGKAFSDLFDDHHFRNLAIQLEYHYQEKEREEEYQIMQELQLKKIRDQAEATIKPKNQNPMNPRNKTFRETKPILNFSQSSQNSEVMSEEPSQFVQEISKDEELPNQNPFLKSKASQSADERKRQIDEQVQKFGIKKKVQERKKMKKF